MVFFWYKFCPWNKHCHVPFPKVVKLYDAHVKSIEQRHVKVNFSESSKPHNRMSTNLACISDPLRMVLYLADSDRDNVWTCNSSKWDPSPCFTFMANYEYTNQGRESNISNIYNVSKVPLQMSDISDFVR